jgi:tetratricopeptide (TPR) repeat protein
MTDQDIKAIYTQIFSSLTDRRLKPAFDMLEKLITENGLGIYMDECINLENTYHQMLKYTVEGVLDPERQKVYHNLIVSVFELADNVNEALRIKFSHTIEYERKRTFRTSVINNTGQYLDELEGLFEHGKESSIPGTENSPFIEKSDSNQKDAPALNQKLALAKIQKYFYHIWFIDRLSTEESRAWSRFMLSPLIPLPYKSFMISAMMFSLQRFFDPGKLALLFDYCNSEEPEISQRALTGLLVNLYKYDSRLQFYPEITGRLKILSENPQFMHNTEVIITHFIRSKGTEKLQQRIREEILPDMIRISTNLKDKINLDSLMEEGPSEDRNPDWENMLRDSPGFFKKMEEFMEMQMKGDDVFMGSFSMLKSFPFFDEPVNWFIPFFPGNPEIAETIELNEQTIRQLVNTIEMAPILCNSDKYSFCLSIRRLPAENLGIIMQAMQAEMEQIKELSEDEKLINPERIPEFVSNQYIQDLYRFYKLFPRKADFEDIFNWQLDFHHKQVFAGIFKEEPRMHRNIAEYYFAREYFEEAAGIFTSLLEQEKSEDLYQKIAWCNQKMGDFKAALDGYLKAELFGTHNVWTLKKIALCYRNLRKPDKALEYYYAAEKADTENLSIQLNIGHCLLELNQYEDALKCYFKVEYLAPGNKKVWRPLGWCSFITGKKEQAEKYFLMLIADEPNKHDFISMGHVQWSLGQRRSALDFYRKSMSGNGFSEAEFLLIFYEDLPHLLSHGIDKDDIPIMLDQLRYYLES